MANMVLSEVLDMYHPMYHRQRSWQLMSAKKQKERGLRRRT